MQDLIATYSHKSNLSAASTSLYDVLINCIR